MSAKRRGRMVPKKQQQKQAPAPTPAPEPEVPDHLDVDTLGPTSEMRQRADASAFAERYETPDPDEPIVDTLPHRSFEPSLDHDTLPVDEKSLRLLMRDWRHGRATRTIMQAISDAYVGLFSVLVLGAMIWGAVSQVQGAVSSCTAGVCLSARAAMPWAILAGGAALALGASRLFGPVLASAAEGFWLMDAPVRRSRLLRSRLVAIVIVSGVIGALLGALVAALTGWDGTGIGAWAGATGLVTAGLVAFAAAEQGAERTLFVRVLQMIASLVAVAALAMVVAIAAGWTSLTLTPDRSVQVALVLAAAGALMLVISFVLALLRLDRIRRARLTSGGSLVSGMQGAMFALDLGLVRDILVEREAIERGHVRPTKGRGLGISALVWRDAQRLVRFPKPLLTLLLTLVVPYAVDALGFAVLNPFVSALVLMMALIPLMGSLRVLSRTGGLARTLPFPTSTIRTAAMVVPAALAFVWVLAAVPAFMGVAQGEPHHSLVSAFVTSFITGIAGVLAAVRWVSAKAINFNRPMVATGAGALPPGLLGNLVRGFDMVILITAPTMLGFSPMWSLGIALIAFLFLRGGMDVEQLQAQQEEQKKELARMREEAKQGRR